MHQDQTIEKLQQRINEQEEKIAAYQHAEQEQQMVLEALELVNEIDTFDDLMQSIIQWMKRCSGCEAVAIRLREGEDFPYYTTSGFSDTFVRLEKYLCSYNEDGSVKRDPTGQPELECMCGNILRGRFDPSKNFFTVDGSFWSNSTTDLLSQTTDTDRQSRTRNRCNSFGYESVALIPLRTAGETFGLLQLNDHQRGKFSPEMIATFRRVADHVASLLAKAQAGKALKASEEQFKAVVEHSADAIGVSIAGRHILVNQAYLKMFGYRHADALIGQPTISLIAPRERERVTSYAVAREKGESVPDYYRTIGLKSDGSEFEMEVKVAVYGPQPEPKNLVIFRDISESAKKEKEWKTQKYFLEKAQAIGKMGTWELDISDNVLVWTDENYGIFGIPKGTELTYEIFLGCIHPDDRKFVDQKWKAALSGEPYDIEHRVISQGAVKWVREKAMVEFDDQGVCCRAVGVTQDITEQRRSQDRLRESEAALKQAQKLAGLGNWQWDVKNDTHVWSEEIYQIYGRDMKLPPAVYPEVKQYFTPESWAGLAKQVERSIAQGLPYQCDAEVIRPDGERRWITTRGEAVHNSDGELIKLQGTVQDVTERKSTEKLLQWNVQRYELLSETAARLLLSDNPQDIIGDLCTKVMELLDCQVFLNFLEDSKNGKLHLNACAGIPEDKRKGIEWIEHGSNVHQTAANTQRRMMCEDILKTSTPLSTLVKTLNLQAYCCHPLMIENRLLGTLSFARILPASFRSEEIEVMEAITNQMAIALNRIESGKAQARLETQLRQAQKVEAIGRLAGGVAHDLNNLLTPVLGYSEMLLDEFRKGDERREFVQHVVTAGSRMRDLVRQLLAFSRKQVLQVKPLDINLVIEGIEKLLLRTIPEDITFEKNLFAGGCPVMADISQVEQIVMNLAVNAADAMPEGGTLIIETALCDVTEEYADLHLGLDPGRYVLLSLSDTGCGMDKEIQEHIFEPFFTTKGEQGTGLGLATIYGIVKQHGGYTLVYSEPGIGTTFKIYLPAVETRTLNNNQEEQKQPAPGGTETILLVEDNKQVRIMALRILERAGYNVLAAGAGEEAVEMLKSHEGTVELLLTDVVMPGMNGKELYQKVMQLHPNVKVLYMSGYTNNVIAQRGVLDDGVQFIQKPFSISGLSGKVRTLLDEK